MRKSLMLVMVMIVITVSGCRKPPKVEKFEEVSNNETAFVIQQEGESQVKVNSLDALAKMKVTAKRINIPLRFRKTGRYDWDGHWIPTVKVIKVNRSPVTRAWSAAAGRGTSISNQGIWMESSDSIGFSTGFNCTARVEEKNAALYLYTYSGDALTIVMDAQIRNEIQAVGSEVAAAYKMDDCREKKLEIIARVREVVIPKYAKTGITIDTIGMFGGFDYEDKEIQTAINKIFVAQQLKEQAAAELVAQKDKNATIEMAAIGLKNAAVTKATGEAEAVTIAATAEAAAILAVAKAANEANDNPIFLELKKLEIEAQRLTVWNGAYPNWITGGAGESLGVFINK